MFTTIMLPWKSQPLKYYPLHLKHYQVLLVGEAKAGKTSLMRRLLDNSYNKQESQTDGIIIEEFNFAKLKTFAEQEKLHGIKAYFWDFGGQEIMHSTHQFFMTKRSVYILVLEARKDEKAEQQVRQWLNRIKAFGGNSQVIVVVNKMDENRAFKLDEYRLHKDFSQIKQCIYVSCDTPENIDKVKIALEEFIPQTELFNTEIDERWFPIKEKLQARTAKTFYLPEREFVNICSEYNLQEETEQNSAIRFLNDLGIILHFEKLKLAEFYVLDPYWVTSGVYRIITSDEAGENKGIIEFEHIKKIVNSHSGKKNKYISEAHQQVKYFSGEVRYIVDIMAQFKLCFYVENEQKILIPDLLDKNTPEKESEIFTNASEKLCLIYTYDYLPNSVLPRLIVEMKKDIEDVWRTGVILHCQACINARAMVISSENQIQIIVTGDYKQKREYLSIIRFFIDNINKDFTVKPSILIPLPDHPEIKIEYDEIIGCEKMSMHEYPVGKLQKTYPIKTLLDGIDTKEEIQKQRQVINQIYSNDSNDQGNIEGNTKIKTIKIFLASSSELKDDRNEFEILINRENKEYVKDGLFLELEKWEDFVDAMSPTGLQDKYNEAIKECDIFVMLFWSKVGKYTMKEFETAFGQFKTTTRPFVYTYFKDAPIDTGKLNRQDAVSLFDFQEKLKVLGHFQTEYKNIDALKNHFSMQLRKVLPLILDPL